jgi:hypothetical protein
LQFVVIVLVAEINARATEQTNRAFGTPNIVHFCAALLNAATLSAPWRRLGSGAAAIALIASVGLAYTSLALRHARRQQDYMPVLEDWIWHFVLPLLAYAALVVSGVLLPRDPAPLLFVVGGASLLLLFVGIHNAWDSVTYIALARRRRGDGERGETRESGRPPPAAPIT